MKKIVNAENTKLIDVSAPFSKYVDGKGYAENILVLATATEVEFKDADNSYKVPAVIGETVDFNLVGLNDDGIEVVGATVGALTDFTDISKVASKPFKGYAGELQPERKYRK